MKLWTLLVIVIFISVISIVLANPDTTQRKPNTFDDTADSDFCANEANGYAYDGSYVYCDTDLSASFNPTYFWNNTDVTGEHSETINSATFGTYYNCTDNGAGTNPWNISYGFASTPGSCGTVSTWYYLADEVNDVCGGTEKLKLIQFVRSAAGSVVAVIG